MDKKYLIKMLLINSAWILWIALSVFFGYLIADAYFPDNMATFIPFSLIFLVFGGGVAYAVYRIFFKKKGSGGAQNNGGVLEGEKESGAHDECVDSISGVDAVNDDDRSGDISSIGKSNDCNADKDKAVPADNNAEAAEDNVGQSVVLKDIADSKNE